MFVVGVCLPVSVTCHAGEVIGFTLVDAGSNRDIGPLNGDLVNHGTKCTATKGQIALQAEGSEVEFRKLSLTTIEKLTD